MFCTCSRICSMASLISTAMAVMSAAMALEPRVLASRLSSCIRKSSRLPAAPPALRMRSTSSEVGGQAGQFLGHVDALGEQAHFGRMRSSSRVAAASRRRVASFSLVFGHQRRHARRTWRPARACGP